MVKNTYPVTQSAFPCSNSTWKHQNNVWSLFKFNNKDTTTTSPSMTSVWCLYCYIWTDSTHWSGVSIADFKQVSTDWKLIVFSKWSTAAHHPMLSKLRVKAMVQMKSSWCLYKGSHQRCSVKKYIHSKTLVLESF